MRKILLLTLILLVSAAWVVAQQGSNSQAPSASSPSQGASSQTSSGQAAHDSSTSPQASSGQAAQPPSGENSIEGCLGGSAGNYTIIDKAGTSYKLELPQNANTSVLDQHIGQEVRVTGTVANAAGSAGGASKSTESSAGSAAGTSASQASIKVARLQKVGDTCSTNTNAPKK